MTNAGDPIEINCDGWRAPIVARLDPGYSIVTKLPNGEAIDETQDLVLDASEFLPS